ncbi:tRNA (N(6)-L-threonylcarbamoyladenosine(37)-C(2))-methylthiotransferase MtaB [Helicobacter mehlei]|uniref:tRNA (N(6)-L-threonylcarbamoyladenosine(37)-C(2))-methylthiotransferase MtaB n=1 Tax=Helicobacter mehlei TaxID=2316080 RepID=A0A553V3J2_9HELI|nr:tRNA (N(6)-L-threonylcarbamoyladenosine(37)-C(2))-methylthiotransferase MtaB [Helicobacter mehlei]TSA87026.1 tRNA (N(6)-L-threonylcarbamoyladenosine(37)-C(2))-methylthiotransferase MtaB [Helicobacter mehlei]
MKQKVYFKTFGCRTNLFDTQVMLAHLKAFERVDCEQEADIVVLNSCTVTNDADYSARAYAKKMHALGKRVFFTGCGANTQGHRLFKSGHVFGVFGHDHKTQIDGLLQQEKSFFYEDKQEKLDQSLLQEFVGKTRAFVKIQEGCDFKCSYCIIPSVRGKSRSLSENQILEQCQVLAQSGVLEVVLTGTNVGSYGKDTKSNMAGLIKKIAQNTPIKRIRIGSLEPSQIDAEFLELLDHPILEKHLHIALQHSHDSMLKRMRRVNRVKSDRVLFEHIASKGFALGTDFIVGHPFEDEPTWQQAWENFKQLPLTHIHPFIYSPRAGTPSSTMPNRINGSVARTRLNQIKHYVQGNNLAFRQALRVQGQVLEVLVESYKEGYYYGHDQYFNPIKIQASQDLCGQWVEFRDYEVLEDGNYAAF